MEKTEKFRIPDDYLIIITICILFIVVAFAIDAPLNIINGYLKINTSRSVLVSDYIAMAGIGATLVNSAISGFFFMFFLVINKCRPNGRIIAALFVTLGFSLFGKNMFNTIPIFVGVWLHSKLNGVSVSDFIVKAMFSVTIAPVVSEIAFLEGPPRVLNMIMAYAAGLFIGYIIPVVTESAKRMHRGYCLYNTGIAGGLLATFFAGLLRSFGVEIKLENFWDTSHTHFMASITYAFAFGMVAYGLITDKPGNALQKFRQLLNETDVRDRDYLAKYGNTCYINIGIMCILSTTIVLILGIPINGPVLGGIFTVTGFAALGKHMKNSVPIFIGSITAAILNHMELSAPVNSLAILFSTGLAPITGKHGWPWGIFIGFIHVSVAILIGQLNGGLNLYNNGFAEGFVAITFVPIIVFAKETFAKYRKKE